MRKTWVFEGPPKPTPGNRESWALLHKDKGQSECFGHRIRFPRPSYTPTAPFERTVRENYSRNRRDVSPDEVRTGPKVGSSQPPIGRSPMFCIVVPCGEPEQKRPPPTVKAAFGGSGQPDLNRRPRRPERRALPGCAMPRLNCRHVYRADSGSRSGPTPSRILSTCP